MSAAVRRSDPRAGRPPVPRPDAPSAPSRARSGRAAVSAWCRGEGRSRSRRETARADREHALSSRRWRRG
ncbi:MAG: hypothetical protein GEU93_22380 [Propionibacteriales bacterium]|nr:hypothetical protein [Propionibacteriales bacterium]